MVTIRHLDNAPIQEAVIDIRASVGSSIEQLEQLHDRIRSEFPTMQKRLQRVIKIEESSSTSQFDCDGLLFHSSDQKRIVQFRSDGFTFSQLKPYTAWKEISSEARKLWKIFSDFAKPTAISRLAVRYINVIDIPRNDPFSYFDLKFSIPAQLQQENPTLDHFLIRLVLNLEGAKALINLSSLGPPDPTKFRFLLDIDVFHEEPASALKPNSEAIWNVFHNLSAIEDRIFFSCITDKTVKLFERRQ